VAKTQPLPTSEGDARDDGEDENRDDCRDRREAAQRGSEDGGRDRDREESAREEVREGPVVERTRRARPRMLHQLGREHVERKIAGRNGFHAQILHASRSR
jgi:hypothetical protein